MITLGVVLPILSILGLCIIIFGPVFVAECVIIHTKVDEVKFHENEVFVTLKNHVGHKKTFVKGRDDIFGAIWYDFPEMKKASYDHRNQCDRAMRQYNFMNKIKLTGDAKVTIR